MEILRLSRGETEVLFFEKTSGKYVKAKDLTVDCKDMMLGALRALLGTENVVYQ
jgi:hypothetical protein